MDVVTSHPIDTNASIIKALVPGQSGYGTWESYTLKTLLEPLGLRVECELSTPRADTVELLWPDSPQRRLVIETSRLRQAFERISGLAEQQLTRDRLGRVGASSLADACRQPDLSRWGVELAAMLERMSGGQWRMPSKRLTVYLTHDVDRVRALEFMGLLGRLVRAGKGLLRGRFMPMRSLAHWVLHSPQFLPTFETIMRLEQEMDACATYYFMCGPYSLRRYGARSGRSSTNRRRIVAMVQRHGHRIGLHGCVYSLEGKGYLQQRLSLSRSAGIDVKWHRNHYLVYDTARSPSLLAQAGLTVDSSCGFYDTNGFRAGLAWPYELWESSRNAPAGVMEVPMVFMDAAAKVPLAQEWAQLYQRLEAAAEVGGAVAILFHIDFFVGHRDRVEGYRELLRWLVQKRADLKGNENGRP